jgi:hypothetical protein
LALAMARTVLPKNFKLGRGFTGDARATSGVGTVVGAPPAQDARTGALARGRGRRPRGTSRRRDRATSAESTRRTRRKVLITDASGRE